MGIDRLMSILLVLINEKTITGKQLAERFEVSLRTIYRDMEKLCEAGVPIAASGGEGGGYYIMDGYRLDRNFISREESAPLFAVMENLNTLFGHSPVMGDLPMKLESVKRTVRSGNTSANDSNRLVINLSHFNMEQELRECLSLTSRAMDEELLLCFEYINRRMECETRIVEPYRVSFNSGEWYLFGFCRDRMDYRQFKLVRIRNIRTDGHYAKRSITDEEIEKLMYEGYYRNAINCVLKFPNKKGMHLGEHFHKECIRQLKDGSFQVEEAFPNDEGLYRFILGFGVDCEVVEPPELREQIKDYISRVSGIYDNVGKQDKKQEP